jgi:hypothetical protein
VAEIVLFRSRGVALFDDEDLDLVLSRSRKWHIVGPGYAGCTVRNPETGELERITMHRLIMGFPPRGMDVDHINGIRLDNRRSNLRAVPRGVNRRNTGPNAGSASGFRGVSVHPPSGRWRARTSLNKRPISLGLHDTPEAAHAAVLAWEAAHFRELSNQDIRR